MQQADFNFLTDFNSFSEPCRENQLANMDTELYGFETSSETLLKPVKIGDHRSAGLEDLDPSLELAVDLSDYISSNVTDELFPDIFQPQVATAATSQKVYTTLTQQMPHIIQSSEFFQQGSRVVKVEPEDISTLDFSSLLFTPLPVNSDDLHSTASSDFAYSEISPTVSPVPSPSPRQTYKSPSSKSRRKNEVVVKESDDYKDRRARNNVAVRKSRDKAKIRQQHTEDRVQVLTSENDRLQKKVDLLSKELTVLKGLFTNVDGGFPAEFSSQLDMLSKQ